MFYNNCDNKWITNDDLVAKARFILNNVCI